LSFVDLISNILQQNSINLSKPNIAQSSAFYIKKNFIKASPSKTSQFQKSSYSQNPSTSSFSQCPSSSNRQSTASIICHYYGIPDHKAPDFRKKKRNVRNSKPHVNNITTDDPIYIYSAMKTPSLFQSYYLDSSVSQQMSPMKILFQDY